MNDETIRQIRALCKATLTTGRWSPEKALASKILGALDEPRVGHDGVRSITSTWSAEDGFKVEVERDDSP